MICEPLVSLSESQCSQGWKGSSEATYHDCIPLCHRASIAKNRFAHALARAQHLSSLTNPALNFAIWTMQDPSLSWKPLHFLVTRRPNLTCHILRALSFYIAVILLLRATHDIMFNSDRGQPFFKRIRLLGLKSQEQTRGFLTLRIRTMRDPMPQFTRSVMVSIPVCKLSIWDFGDSMGFGTVAKINNLLA